jgi:hypothetical protein
MGKIILLTAVLDMSGLKDDITLITLKDLMQMLCYTFIYFIFRMSKEDFKLLTYDCPLYHCINNQIDSELLQQELSALEKWTCNHYT